MYVIYTRRFAYRAVPPIVCCASFENTARQMLADTTYSRIIRTSSSQVGVNIVTGES